MPNKKELIKKFEQKYNFNNIKLHKKIRKILKTPEGILLIAGISEFLEDNVNFKNKYLNL